MYNMGVYMVYIRLTPYDFLMFGDSLGVDDDCRVSQFNRH